MNMVRASVLASDVMGTRQELRRLNASRILRDRGR